VLVVEDQKSIATLLCSFIRDRWGCEVQMAHSLKETRKLLADTPRDFLVAVCDLNLPDAPHGEVIDLMREHDIATIVLTGAFGDDMRTAILRKGAIDYVLKNSVNAFEYVADMVGRVYRNRHTKVLVVDDSLTARALLKHQLESLRFQVITAASGGEGLALAAKHPDIRLVMVDYLMPGMDGFTFVQELRKSRRKDSLVIIGISSIDDENVTSYFLKSGANDFVKKSVAYEEMLCRLNQNLDMLEFVDLANYTARHDYLTGAHNRRFLFEHGTEILQTELKAGHYLGVAIIDIDYFKKVNDTHGHACGDAVLKEVASVVIKHCGDEGFAARMGGEEFAVLIPDTDLAGFRTMMNRLRVGVKRQSVAFEGQSVSCTISIGICGTMEPTLDAMFQIADANLYLAKEQGRNRVAG
jgi:diguanylate cyclase (GGDEF)-like protein